MMMDTTNQRSEGLLELLAAKAGCLYISDLRFMPHETLAMFMEDIDPDAFSPSEWQEASAYLLTSPEDYSFRKRSHRRRRRLSLLRNRRSSRLPRTGAKR